MTMSKGTEFRYQTIRKYYDTGAYSLEEMSRIFQVSIPKVAKILKMTKPTGEIK